MIRFLCGCTSKLEIPIPGDTEQQTKHLKTFDMISFDAEGFIICKPHGMRRYGWRAPLGPIAGGRSDVEWEHLQVWGRELAKPKLNFTPSEQRDLRPHVYEGMLDETALRVLAVCDRAGDRNGGGNETSFDPYEAGSSAK